MQSKRSLYAMPVHAPTRGRVAGMKADPARVEFDATNVQLRALQALTDTALSHLALDDLLTELLDRVTDVMRVDEIGLFLLDEDGQTLTIWAARGTVVEQVCGGRVVIGQCIPGRIAASRAPLVLDAPSAADFGEAPPFLQERMHSIAGVPLLVEDQVGDHLASRLVGVLVVGSTSPRHFTEADVQLLQRAGDRIALAVDRAHLFAAEQEARRQAEVALARARASEMQAAERAERLNTILETMADGVAVYDAAGHPIQMVNRAYREMFAVDRGPDGYEGLPTFERSRLVQVRDAATGAPLHFDETPVGRAMRGEVVTGPSADIRARAFDGRELEVNSSATPLQDPDGRVAGVVLVLRDMTERNRLAREREVARADELAAREASRRMEEFVAVAAHDLRAPLTAVLGYLDLAEGRTERLASMVPDQYPGLTQQIAAALQSLDEASQGAERLKRLLTLLFDTAAIRSGKLELHRTSLDLTALVREQVETLRVAAPNRTIRLRAPAGSERIHVHADADRIGQVLANYVTNALKYSPPDQPIAVSVQVHGEGRGCRARVLVCDRGPGIPTEERARVWDLFHRARGASITAHGETSGGMLKASLGLGLHISKAIITAHGGRVGVKSTVGGGSTFWFTLPVAASAQAVTSRPRTSM